MAKKAHAERAAKRNEKDNPGLLDTAADLLNNSEDIHEASSSNGGTVINSLKVAATEHIKDKGIGRFVNAVKRVVTRSGKEKSEKEAQSELVEKVGEASITGISAWLYKTYRDLSLLSFPPMAVINIIASLIGFKFKIIVLTLTKIKGEIYVGLAVHKSIATPVGFVLSVLSYILMWKIFRLSMKALKVIFRVV